MTKFRTFLIFVSLLVLAMASCAPATNAETSAESATFEESNNSIPNYDDLETSIPYYYDSYFCPNTWTDEESNPIYNGLESKITWISTDKNLEMKTATLKFLVELNEIHINDRVVYPQKNWYVLQQIPKPDNDGFFLTHELHPEEWATKAKDLSILAPDLVITRISKWAQYYQNDPNSYTWNNKLEDVTCAKK